MMMTGIALLIAGVAVALMGVTEWHFRIALGLNGVGWNFLFVGATTLLTTTYRPAERGKAQAFNDFMVFGTTTTASLMASVVLELEGLGRPQLRGAGPGSRGVAGDRRVPPAPSRRVPEAKPLRQWGFSQRRGLRRGRRSVIFRPPRAGGGLYFGTRQAENAVKTIG